MAEDSLPPRLSDRPFVFVVMPFAREFDDIYKYGIKKSAELVGAYAERVDEQHYDGLIIDRIFNQIRTADVIVADVTGRNPSVFYEVGVAHALDKIVVLMSKSLDEIPFDLKSRPHIIYDGEISRIERELPAKLRWAIGASKMQSRETDLGALRIFVEGQEIHEKTSQSFSGPLVAQIAADGCLYVQIVNAGSQRSEWIEYVYLLAAGFDVIKCNGSRSMPRPVLNGSEWANSMVYLKEDIEPIPPGASFMLRLEVVSKGGMMQQLALRLAGNSGIRDYPFMRMLPFEAR